jgi:hypothetical protein
MQPPRKSRLFGLALVLTGSWATLAEPARADGPSTTISADLDAAESAGSSIGGGWGFGVRLGERFHVPLVALEPEIGFTFHDFGSGFEPKMYRGIVGVRIGLLEVLRPGVFGHVGVGHIDFDKASDLSHTAFTYDVGVFLDLTVLPLLDLGIHFSYDGIASSDQVDTVNWVTFGLHASLVF